MMIPTREYVASLQKFASLLQAELGRVADWLECIAEDFEQPKGKAAESYTNHDFEGEAQRIRTLIQSPDSTLVTVWEPSPIEGHVSLAVPSHIPALSLTPLGTTCESCKRLLHPFEGLRQRFNEVLAEAERMGAEIEEWRKQFYDLKKDRDAAYLSYDAIRHERDSLAEEIRQKAIAESRLQNALDLSVSERNILQEFVDGKRTTAKGEGGNTTAPPPGTCTCGHLGLYHTGSASPPAGRACSGFDCACRGFVDRDTAKQLNAGQRRNPNA